MTQNLTPYLLGLDLDAQKAEYCLSCGIEVKDAGRVTLEDFPAFLEALAVVGMRPEAMACEFTGGIGGPWLIEAEWLGLRAYVLHTVERKAYQVLDNQTVKTDKRDALGIVRTLARWYIAPFREALGLQPYLFQEWKQVKVAWELRALVADVSRATKAATSAANRAGASRRMGHATRAEAWEQEAEAHKKSVDRFYDLALVYAREHYSKELDLLLSVPRVGERTALILLSAFMPLERFAEVSGGRDHLIRNVERYTGFMPRRQESGGKVLLNERYHGGNRKVRSALYIACMGIPAFPTGPLGEYYQRLTAGGDAPGRAVYLCAKKVLHWSIGALRSGEPCRNAGEGWKRRQEVKEKFITGSEAAKLTGMSRQALYLRRDRGLLQHIAPEGMTEKRFLLAEIEALAEEISRGGTRRGTGKKKEAATE